MKSDDDEKWTLDGTDDLIDCAEKNAEEDVEGMELTSRTTRQGQGRE